MGRSCEVCGRPVEYQGETCIVCGYTDLGFGDPKADGKRTGGTFVDPGDCPLCEDDEDGERCDVCGHLIDCEECDD